jgi:hypothetical protein
MNNRAYSISPAPANFTDFSMFGGAPPTVGVYFALTPGQLWVYASGDTQWRYSDLISA